MIKILSEQKQMICKLISHSKHDDDDVTFILWTQASYNNYITT